MNTLSSSVEIYNLWIFTPLCYIVKGEIVFHNIIFYLKNIENAIIYEDMDNEYLYSLQSIQYIPYLYQ